MNLDTAFTRGNVRKVNNFGGWECVITSPTGNVGKAYGDNKSEVGANGTMFAEAPAMVKALREFAEIYPVMAARNGTAAILARIDEN